MERHLVGADLRQSVCNLRGDELPLKLGVVDNKHARCLATPDGLMQALGRADRGLVVEVGLGNVVHRLGFRRNSAQGPMEPRHRPFDFGCAAYDDDVSPSELDDLGGRLDTGCL